MVLQFNVNSVVSKQSIARLKPKSRNMTEITDNKGMFLHGKSLTQFYWKE